LYWREEHEHMGHCHDAAVAAAADIGEGRKVHRAGERAGALEVRVRMERGDIPNAAYKLLCDPQLVRQKAALL